MRKHLGSFLSPRKSRKLVAGITGLLLAAYSCSLQLQWMGHEHQNGSHSHHHEKSNLVHESVSKFFQTVLSGFEISYPHLNPFNQQGASTHDHHGEHNHHEPHHSHAPHSHATENSQSIYVISSGSIALLPGQVDNYHLHELDPLNNSVFASPLFSFFLPVHSQAPYPGRPQKAFLSFLTFYHARAPPEGKRISVC